MAIFRKRALKAMEQPAALDDPLLLLRPALRQRLRSNVAQLLAMGSNPFERSTRTRELLQQDPTECGAVSLSILLQYHGRYVPLAELRQACGVSRDGSDAANLVRAAGRYGLLAKGFKKGLEALKGVQLPVIIFWNFEHFLVLEAIENDQFWLNDPAIGRRCVDLEAFDSGYTGVVLTMAPGPEFVRTPAPASKTRLLAKRMGAHAQPLGVVLFCSLAASLALGLIPLLTKQPTAPTTTATAMLLLPLGLAALLLPSATRGLSRALQHKESRQFQQQLLSLPDWVLSQRFSADLAGRLALIPQLGIFLHQQLWPSLVLLAASAIWGLVLLPHHPLLTAFLWLGIAGVLLVSNLEQRRQQTRNAQGRIAELKPKTVLYGGLRDPDTLKASALERDLFQRWSGLHVVATRQRQRLDYEQDLTSWLPDLLLQGLLLLLIGFGIQLALLGSLGFQALVALQLICLGLAESHRRSKQLLAQWPQTSHNLSRLDDLLEQTCDPLLSNAAKGSSRPAPLAGPRLSGQISLRQLCFGYIPVQPPLIQNLDLEIEPGQRIAIVGGSASGKSTLARLLAGLLQPTAGELLVDGRPLLAWPRQVRLRSIAMVQQSSSFLSCSLRDNLSFWDPSLSTQQLEQACADAAILERIASLPEGFETPLLEAGRQLSGGERQRLQIAQALLQKPSILILDEATSALDPATELQVEQALRRQGCTQIVVAHRLSTVRDADQILVFEKGRLIQRGQHGEMKRDATSPYAQLLLQEQSSFSMEPSPPAQPTDA